MRSSKKAASFQIQDGFSDSGPASAAVAAAAVMFVMSQERIYSKHKEAAIYNRYGMAH